MLCLFVCVYNAGRSQISQALFNSLKKEFPSVDRRYEAISAGITPGSRLDALSVEAMKEIGIDMSDSEVYFPKGLNDDYLRKRGNKVERVIIACDDKCQLPPEIRSNLVPEYWKLPAGKRLEEVRKVRDSARRRVYDLLKELESKGSSEISDSA